MTRAKIAMKARGIAVGAHLLADQLEIESEWTPAMFSEAFMSLAERCVAGAGMVEKAEEEAERDRRKGSFHGSGESEDGG